MNTKFYLLKPIFNRLILTKLKPKRISSCVFTNKMGTIRELEEERKSLENKIHGLVDQLEAKKKPNDIRVPRDAVIKSKEERESIEAFEQLDLNKASEIKKPSEAITGPKKSDNPVEKKQEHKGGKQRGDAGSKEPEKPIDVSRLDLRIGKILEVSHHPDADSLYLEKIDCGETTGPRTVISGLVKHVPIDEMKDRLVVVLCNLKPAKMRGIVSEAMVMCASTSEKVELIQPPNGVKPGDRIVFEKYPGEPDQQLNPKKKIWEQVAPDIKTDDEGVAYYKDCKFRVVGVDGQFKSSLKNVQIR